MIGEGADYAKSSYQSLYGEIKVRWKKDKKLIHFDIVVPANVNVIFNYLTQVKVLEPGTHHIEC